MKFILHTSYPAYEDGTDRVFRNVGIQQSDAGEILKRIHTRFNTRRKFEIKIKEIKEKSSETVKLFLLVTKNPTTGTHKACKISVLHFSAVHSLRLGQTAKTCAVQKLMEPLVV